MEKKTQSTTTKKSADFENLKKTILLKPVDLLQANMLSQAAFEIQEQKLDDDVPREGLVAQIEKTVPFFFINECGRHSSEDCLLSRFKNPKLRQKYAEIVSAALIEKINRTEETVKYTTVSTPLFSDLEILTRTLDKKSNAKIAIDVVDIFHGIFDLFCTVQSKDHSLDNLMEKTIGQEELGKMQELVSTPCSSEVKKERLVESFSVGKTRNNQLLNGLRKMFPKADLTLSVYNCVDHYLNHAADDDFLVPDIVCGDDIEHEFDLSDKNFASKAFHELSIAALVANPTAKSILLSKKCEGIIQTITRKPTTTFYYEVQYIKPSVVKLK